MVSAAVGALFIEDPLVNAVGRGAVSRGWMFLPPTIFVGLFVAYVADRWSAVRAGRYPASRALAQTALGVIFASVLMSSTVSHYRGHHDGGPDRLLLHPDAQIRRTAVYALGFFAATPDAIARVTLRLEDRSPDVKMAAQDVLGRWSGRDPGDVSGIRAWASASSRTSTRSDVAPR